MLSLTYVNEIDIGELKLGQKVNIGLGAFPAKKLTGEIIYMANVGEQIPNTNAKVFEVKIRIFERDPDLKPSMTTINSVIVEIIEDVLYIPIETTHKNDSLTFVYMREGYKKEVILGEKNENFVIVEEGLKEGDKLYLSMPTDIELFKTQTILK